MTSCPEPVFAAEEILLEAALVATCDGERNEIPGAVADENRRSRQNEARDSHTTMRQLG